MWHYTCSVRSAQPESFSTVWATTSYDIWDSVAKPGFWNTDITRARYLFTV
ncbi:MAG: hypothetical protein ACHQAW_05145 [Actinomycetota bacterium]|jgi:hypothetical protein